MPTYEAELEIDTLLGSDGYDKNLAVELDMSCSRFSTPPSGIMGPPASSDPGDEAEFEIDAIRVTGGTDEKPIMMEFTVEQFEAMFPSGDFIIAQAYEWAAECEEDFR